MAHKFVRFAFEFKEKFPKGLPSLLLILIAGIAVWLTLDDDSHYGCHYDWEDLGRDWKTGQFRSWEADTGARLMDDYLCPRQLASQLTRHNPQGHPKDGDWIDDHGRTYDGVSAVSHVQFSLEEFKLSIYKHLREKTAIDYIVVDTTDLPQGFITDVVDYTREVASHPRALNYIGLGLGWSNFK